MKKMVALLLAAASVMTLQAMGDNSEDICETELMACNSSCDVNNPTESCYQECQEKYESCLAEADMEEEDSDDAEAVESDEPKEE